MTGSKRTVCSLKPSFLAKNVDLWRSARASRGRRGLHGTLLAARRRTSCLLAVSQPHKQCYGASSSHPTSLLPAPEIDIFSQFGPSQEEFANRVLATRLHNNKARPELASTDRINQVLLWRARSATHANKPGPSLAHTATYRTAMTSISTSAPLGKAAT